MKTRQLMKRLKEKYKDEKVFVVLSSTINNIPDKFNKFPLEPASDKFNEPVTESDSVKFNEAFLELNFFFKNS